MKWGSTAASGSGLLAFQPSMSLEVGSRKVHAHFFLNAPSGAGCLPTERSVFLPSSRKRSQCTFWCRVLTDAASKPGLAAVKPRCLNAPSGAGCLPTSGTRCLGGPLTSLNAPSGAGCLPTCNSRSWSKRPAKRLNAPSGAGCLPTQHGTSLGPKHRKVSMHLLVPGAYRRRLCKPRRSTVYSTVIATGDPCTLTHR